MQTFGVILITLGTMLAAVRFLLSTEEKESFRQRLRNILHAIETRTFSGFAYAEADYLIHRVDEVVGRPFLGDLCLRQFAAGCNG